MITFLLIGFVNISCEGPEGPAGADGTNGTNGTNGNANVKTITILQSAVTWTNGDYLGVPANTYAYNTSLVNQDVIDHGAVLGYFLLASNWHALPYSLNYGSTIWEHITFTHKLNEIKLYAYSNAGVLNPGVSKWKFIVITDNTITGKSKENVKNELISAGIDINNYYQVCAYYGIDSK